MNKNFRVITINGVRGIIVAVFIVFGLVSGFIVSPGWVCMSLWNVIFEQSNIVSKMNLFQGILLWLIIALSLYALNNKRALIGFGSYQGLSPEQIRDIMNRARQSENKIFNDIKKNDEIKCEDSKTSTDTIQCEEVKVEDTNEVRK